ncbi:MAG: phosphoesterase [Desulfurococcaceae archaeon]
MKNNNFLTFIEQYKSFRIIPDSALDSLIASSILMKNLSEHGWDVKVNLDPKLIIDEKTEPTILINLSPIDEKYQLSLKSTGEYSITAYIVEKLDSVFGIEKFDKVLAIVSGLYLGLYDFKEGKFPGTENDILKELVESGVLYEIAGLRIWGARRVGLIRAINRTLIPFLPGITGCIDRIEKILSDVFKTKDPYSIRYKELLNENNLMVLSSLVQKIVNNLYLDLNKDPKLPYKLFGEFILTDKRNGEEGQEFELHEILGSLVVYASSCLNCPYDLLSISMNDLAISQIIAIYDKIIDQLSPIISASILEFFSSNKPIDPEGYIERPDLVVDMLSYIEKLPKNRPITILHERGIITSLRELLRIGVEPSKAYSQCDGDQLCVVQNK